MSGLISGSLYATMALGLTIVYGVIHVFNFGHGIVAVLGGYFTWLFLTKIGLGLIPSILIALVIMFFFGLDSLQGNHQSAAQDPQLGIFYDHLSSRHGDSFGKLDASGFRPPGKAHSGIF